MLYMFVFFSYFYTQLCDGHSFMVEVKYIYLNLLKLLYNKIKRALLYQKRYSFYLKGQRIRGRHYPYVPSAKASFQHFLLKETFQKTFLNFLLGAASDCWMPKRARLGPANVSK